MKIYGYCRISTKKQSIERQIANIKQAFPEAIIIAEEFTGTKLDRPKWIKLRKQIEKDIQQTDVTIVFDEVSRMSRNAEDGFLLYKELYELGVNLVFLKEQHISTATYRQALNNRIELSINTGQESTDKFIDTIVEAMNQFLLDLVKEQIKLAFIQAQTEVDHLHQRTREGIEQARLAGKQIGQKKGAKLTTKKSIEAKKIIQKYSKDFGGTLADDATITLAGVSRKSYYKYKKQLREEWMEKGHES